MRYVEANGARLSSIGLGCWQFGSHDWGYGKEYGDTVAVPLVHYALTGWTEGGWRAIRWWRRGCVRCWRETT